MGEDEIGRLVVRLIGDPSSLNRAFKEAQAGATAAAGVAQTAGKQVEAVSGSLAGFGRSIAGEMLAAVGATSALGAAIKSIKLAAQEEANVIDFGTMLKSVEAGQKLIQDIQVFAAKTPLGQGDIQLAAKTLLQFGVAGKDVMGVLRQLGDVTGGEAGRFRQMALAFGQMSSSGRLMGQDLLQMINAGFNPLQEISRTTGKSVAALKQEMEKGAISVDMVRAAFVSATQEGGTFSGLMEKRSKSLSGLFSTMGDDIEAAQRAFGKQVVETLHLKDALETVSGAAQFLGRNFEALPPSIKTLTIGTGGFAAAMATLGVALPPVWLGLGKVKDSGLAMTKALAANPFVWVAAAAAGVAYLTARVTGLTEALKDMSKEAERAGQINEAWTKLEAARTQAILGNADRPGARRWKVLDTGISQASAELNRFQERLEAAQSVKAEWFPSIERFQEAVRNVEFYKGKVESMRERIAALKEAESAVLKITQGGGGNPEVFNKYLQSIREEAETYGLAAAEADRLKLARQGLNEFQLNEAQRAAAAAQRVKDFKDQIKDLDKIIKDHQEAAATAGLTETEKKLRALPELPPFPVNGVMSPEMVELYGRIENARRAILEADAAARKAEKFGRGPATGPAPMRDAAAFGSNESDRRIREFLNAMNLGNGRADDPAVKELKEIKQELQRDPRVRIKPANLGRG